GHDLAEDRQRVRRWVGPGQLVDLVADLDGGAVALEAFLGRRPLCGQTLGLAGLLEQRASLGEGRVGSCPSLASAGEGVAVALELVESGLPLFDDLARPIDRLLGNLEPPRVFVAALRQVAERTVEPLLGGRGATVGAADRCLQA